MSKDQHYKTILRKEPATTLQERRTSKQGKKNQKFGLKAPKLAVKP